MPRMILEQIKTWIVLQMLIGYVWVISGFIICFLMLLTTILVWPYSKSLYRKIVNHLAYSHWCQLTVVAQWWSGSNCTIVLEDPEVEKYLGSEHMLVLMNHTYEVDWLMTWVLSERKGLLGGTKVYAKSSLRMLPMIGWMWYFTETIFLERNWEKDKNVILQRLQHIKEYPEGYYVTLLLFCEGTRFTEDKHRQSMEFARQNGFPLLKHHLLPRTKGFVQSMQGIKGSIDSIMDVTIAFRPDGAAPSIMNIVNGKACKAEAYFRRIEISEVCDETDEKCAEFVHKIFQNKDKLLVDFLQDGEFKNGKKIEIPRRCNDLIIALMWGFITCIPLFYFLYYIIVNGSLWFKIGTILLLYFGTVGVRKVIGASEVSRGSAYGKNK